MKTKTIQITAWAKVNKSGSYKLYYNNCEANLNGLNDGDSLVQLTGSYEVPEQTVTISESDIEKAVDAWMSDPRAGKEALYFCFKQALGFK